MVQHQILNFFKHSVVLEFTSYFLTKSDMDTHFQFSCNGTVDVSTFDKIQL